MGNGIHRRYLSAQDAAIYLGIGGDQKARNIIYQWVHRGKLPYTKVGRNLRFDIKALDALLGANAQEARVA